MKRKLTTTLMIAAATMITACGNSSDFTDEEIAAVERLDTLFTYKEDTRQVEESRYPEVRANLQSTGSTIELDNALYICDKLREGLTADELVEDVDPYSPDGYRKVIAEVAEGMCVLG